MKKVSLLLLVLAMTIAIGSCASQPERARVNRMPSQDPPNGLSPEEVPMLVAIGFDDNSMVDSLEWINDYSMDLKNHDGSPVRFSFFCNGQYASAAGEMWLKLYENGHEIGNHSVNHYHGASIDWSQSPATYEVLMTTDEWYEEMVDNDAILQEAGIPLEEMRGFRNPYLEYTDPGFEAAVQRGFVYDCSIEEGYQGDMDATNFYWPYTLDMGSPGNETVSSWIPTRFPIGQYPGLWELPVYPLIIPGDELAEEYDFPPGLRDKINEAKPYLEGSNWKMSGLDYNLWYTDAGHDMLTGQEFLAILKYNLDQRISGNRAPFMLGAHADYYYNDERREALEAFIEYALTKEEVHFATFYEIVEWLENPVALQ